MKDSFIYEAEYISKVANQHYLNIDLGFKTWHVAPFTIINQTELRSGDKVLIESFLIPAHKPTKYSCIILKHI